MGSRPIERELKLDADEDFVTPDLTGVVDGVVVDDLGSSELVARYFDTEDRRLLEYGVTLRHRRGEGPDDGLWTLKLPVPGRGSTLDRRELEWSLPAERPPEEAVELVAGLCRGAPLAEVAVLRTTRRRLILRDGHGRSRAEIDDDVVTGTSAGPPIQFRQIEVELTGGDASLVKAVSRRLRRAHARPASPVPKLQRVLAAADGGSGTGTASKPLGRSSTLGEVAVDSITAGVDRLLTHDPAVRLGEDPEAVHQARVAARRLRSDLEVLGPLFDDGWAKAVQMDLRWLAGVLGRVRDIDVLGQRLEADGDRGDEWSAEGLDALIGRLGALREPAATDLAHAMRGSDYFALVDRLCAARRDPPWWDQAEAGGGLSPGGGLSLGETVGPDRVSGDAVDGDSGVTGHPATQVDERCERLTSSMRASTALPPILRRRRRKVKKAVEALSDPPRAEELHTVRKRSKRLRYNAELATPVVGSSAAALAAAAEGLQEVLGEHHDAVAAQGWLRHAAQTAEPAEAFSAGELAATARRVELDAARTWPEAWATLADKDRGRPSP